MWRRPGYAERRSLGGLWLEVDVGRKLELTLRVLPDAVDGTEAVGVHAGGPLRRGSGNVDAVVNIGVGIIELRMVEDVVGLRTELRPDPLGDGKVLEEADVGAVVAGAVEVVAPQGAGTDRDIGGVQRRSSEDSGEPVDVVCIRVAAELRARNPLV